MIKLRTPAEMPVLTTEERQRLLQAVVFFASTVAALGKIKLFKLLYLFDFEHFKKTGRSATGLDYQAWRMGPVPVELMEEWDNLGEDLAKLIRIESERVIDFSRQAVKLNDGVCFDATPFSPRQLKILTELAEKYKNDLSGPMIDVTHEENGAWIKVWQDGKGKYQNIPYELAIDKGDAESSWVSEVAKEQKMYRAALLASRNAVID